MRILAIETATLRAEVAAVEGTEVKAVVSLPAQPRLTSTLVPAIRQALQQAGWQPRDVQLVAVDYGPGSFTGTRIGLTCAKTFAYATGAELVPICSVDVLAQAVPLDVGTHLAAGLDAARQEVFCGLFQRTPHGWKRTHLGIEPYQRWHRRQDEGYVLTGPALDRYPPTSPTRLAPKELWHPRAEALAQLAFQRAQQGIEPVDYWTLEPLYLRPSAAEEKASGTC